MRQPFIIDNQSKITTEDGVIARYIKTPGGRRALAQSMAAPIRRSLNYHAIARKALAIQQLPQGALPSYDRDIDVSAVILGDGKFKHTHLEINRRGKLTTKARPLSFIRKSIDYHSIPRRPIVSIEAGKFKHDHLVINNCGKLTGKGQYVFARRVVVPTFEIFSNPTIHISDITSRRFSLIDRSGGKPKPQLPGKFKHNVFEIGINGKLTAKGDRKRRRFHVIDRAVQKARQEIMAQEDAAIFAALDAASGNNQE